MKNKRYSLIILFAVVIATVGAAAFTPQTALADSGGGTGTLIADGDGLAGIRGDGEVSISGNGILWIKDHTGDANIHVSGNGYRVELPGGWIRYSGFNGSAEVSGSLITVALSGFNIHLEATGTGRYILRGNGSYSVTKDGILVSSGIWTEDGEVHRIP